MRRAYHDTQWMEDENGQVIGLILGYDFCAEHEFGVGGIHNRFAIKEGVPIGLPDRAIQAVPESLIFEKFSCKPRDRRRKAYPAAMLAFDAYTYDRARFIEYARAEADFYGEPGKQDISTAWGADDFCVLVRGEENIRRLERLYQAFLEKDIVISKPMVSGFLRNGGLAFGILSATPQADKDRILAQDEANVRLLKAVDECGIHEKLKAAGLGFFALSPAWADRAEGGELEFFLNPMKQDKFNHGWFRLDELEAWCDGRGPIIRHPKFREWEKQHYDPIISKLGERLEEEGIVLARSVYGYLDVEADDPTDAPYRNLRAQIWVRKEMGAPAVRVRTEPSLEAMIEGAKKALFASAKPVV